MESKNQKKSKKTTPKEERPKTMEEALGHRLGESETVPPQSHGEIIQMALQDANAEAMMEEREIPETPALRVVPPPVTTPSIPELPSPPQEEKPIKPGLEVSAEEDPDLTALKEYVANSAFNEHWVSLHLTGLCASSLVLPSITLWDIPKGMNMVKLVYDIMTVDYFLDGIWLYLKRIMGGSSGNTRWVAGIAVSIAVFEAIKMIPIAVQAEEGTVDNDSI